jgi:hypothetical protein
MHYRKFSPVDRKYPIFELVDASTIRKPSRSQTGSEALTTLLPMAEGLGSMLTDR